MNKKAVFFHVGIVLALLIIFVSIFVAMNEKKASFSLEKKRVTLGDQQLRILADVNLATGMLACIDIIGQEKFEQVIVELAQAGGINESECGTYNGAVLWTNEKEGNSIIWRDVTKDCMPKNIPLELEKIINESLPQVLFKHCGLPENIKYEVNVKKAKNSTFFIAKPKQMVELALGTRLIGKGKAIMWEDTLIPEGKEHFKIDYLDRIYGSLDIERQLRTLDFFGSEIQIHNKILLPIKKIIEDIKKCDDEYNFNDVRSYRDDDSVHKYGIALDINPWQNPYCKIKNEKFIGYDPAWLCEGKAQLLTDIPDCIIESFQKNGFVWGGDWKNSMHFQYQGAQQ